jgi:hypothetical protein
LAEINRKLGFKDRAIAWRHLANQVSCYGLAEEPGTAYAYNDWQMALFWDTLFLKVYGSSFDNVDSKVLRPLLTDALGCQDRPTQMAFGTDNRPGRLAISVRDFARFGLLYLRKGNWRGRQIVSAEHAAMATGSPLPNSIPRAGSKAAEMIPGQRSIGSRTIPDNQTDHFGSYSWLWWVNGVDREGQRMWPDAPSDTFGAFGHGGPRAMYVIPSLDLVVSYNDARLKGWSSGGSPTNDAMKLLVEAVAEKPEGTGNSTAGISAKPLFGTGLRSTLGPRPKVSSASVRRPSVQQVVRSGDHTTTADPTTTRALVGIRDIGSLGRFAKWATVEISLEGPESSGRGRANPFSLFVDATFVSPSGKQYDVPGYYDGDGQGGLDGNVWKIRFSADEIGRWTFTCRSAHRLLDGYRGRFTVVFPPGTAEGFYRWGRLEAVGTASNRIRYLKFRDGPYWLKAGCDDPENFLGRYKNYDTPAKRMATVDYLAAKGINSMYIMTHNIDGDDKDVWPWLGKSPSEAKAHAGKDARFDIAKLTSWRKLFEQMQRKGVVPYLVLEDDSAWNGYDHARYYREMVARFGDLLALLFNFNEEHNENYSLERALEFMQQLNEIDPYGHPRGIHNVNRPSDAYVDATQVDFTSIQTGSPSGARPDPFQHNRLAIDWINKCISRRKRVLVVNFDEGRPEEDRRAWWSAYLGGGVWEAHVRKPYDRPMSAWDTVWTQLGGARAFMETLPFWEMTPDNQLVKTGTAFCLAKPGKAYALYLPSGGTVAVDLDPGSIYEFGWWRATNGCDGDFQKTGTVPGGTQRFGAPSDGDWALRVVKKSLRIPVR